jgi:hypothetical protein
VPQHYYSLDAAAGTIALIPVTSPGGPHLLAEETGDAVLVDDVTRPFTYSGTELTVTYAPTDTRPGPATTVHIPSTTAPPPIKVARVVPAWSIATSGTPGEFGYTYTRTGNTLRVYMERPWYVTGANEMVAVVTLDDADNGTEAVPKSVTVGADTYSVSIDDITLLALDPISVGVGTNTSQTELSFLSPHAVPPSGGLEFSTYALAGGNPVKVPSVLDPNATVYNLWGYEPTYDPTSGTWYVDIQLKMTNFTDYPPPGYFVRLALARFQPYSIGSLGAPTPSDNRYLSPTTLVTIAQPVADRTVTVVRATDGGLSVTVSGPGYHGFRPAPENPTRDYVHDVDNAYALHPNSDKKGNEATSTMVVEVQKQDTSAGFSGDFGWSTLNDSTFVLTPSFSSSPLVTWGSEKSLVTLGDILSGEKLRLRVSEIDYYPSQQGPPAVIDTTYRRPFVAHIPL